MKMTLRPLSKLNRTFAGCPAMSDFDPKRTLAMATGWHPYRSVSEDSPLTFSCRLLTRGVDGAPPCRHPCRRCGRLQPPHGGRRGRHPGRPESATKADPSTRWSPSITVGSSKLMGDGVLVEFASAVNAVECAVELQEAMEAANDGIPEDRRIVLARRHQPRRRHGRRQRPLWRRRQYRGAAGSAR